MRRNLEPEGGRTDKGRTREVRTWPVWFFFSGALLSVAYVVNAFGWFGLVFWEVAYAFLPASLAGAAWAARRIQGVRRGRVAQYRHHLVVFALVSSVGFSAFAVVPWASLESVGRRFEAEFEGAFGADYWERIPAAYRGRLKEPGSFVQGGDLRHFSASGLTVRTDVPYGSGAYQRMDVYEDESIEGADKPAVIVVHGGGSTTFSTKDDLTYQWTCRYFAHLGFVAFSVEYTPAKVKPFPEGVRDVRTAIAHVKREAPRYHVDDGNVVLFGSSRGGHLVTLAAYTGVNDAGEDSWWRENGGNFTADELRVACVVDLYGAVDPEYPFQHRGFLASRNEIIFGGTPDQLPDTYAEHDVANFLGPACPPTLVVHGTVDGMVQVGESRGLVEGMVDAGVPHVYLEVPTGQHGFDAVPGTAGNSLAYYFVPRFVLLVLAGASPQ
ncbi:MAG: alpha/beta hydrolase [Promethearchaeota archaeon]